MNPKKTFNLFLGIIFIVFSLFFFVFIYTIFSPTHFKTKVTFTGQVTNNYAGSVNRLPVEPTQIPSYVLFAWPIIFLLGGLATISTSFLPPEIASKIYSFGFGSFPIIIGGVGVLLKPPFPFNIMFWYFFILGIYVYFRFFLNILFFIKKHFLLH